MYESLLDAEKSRRLVNPARRPFNFSKRSDGCLVDYNMSLAIAPLGAEFVVSEGRNIPKGEQYLLKFPAIRNPGFGFDSSLVTANLALGLVGKKPFFSVFAEAQNLSALSQRLAGQVVQSIALECARSHVVGSLPHAAAAQGRERRQH